MKILGKYKDYYDYLQGIYGVDPLLVLDRRYDNMLIRRPEEETRDVTVHRRFFVGGKKYNMYYLNGDSYYTLDDLANLNKILLKKELALVSLPYEYGWDKWGEDKKLSEEWWNKENGVESDVNKVQRNPVLVTEINHYTSYADRGKEVVYHPCILKQWDFHKVLPAPETYNEVSAILGYLVDNPVIPNNQNDLEKAVSHGFDTKISFRHRKNK